LGDMRESIKECKKMADDRYLLSFNGNSKWADLTLEMKFNPKTMNLVELIISDNDPQYGKYQIVEDIK
jgi:hypothetical protein